MSAFSPFEVRRIRYGGRSEGRPRTWAHTSGPESPGIIQSRTASGGAPGARIASHACVPFTTTVTSWPHFLKRPVRTRRDVRSSSATRILIGSRRSGRLGPELPRETAHGLAKSAELRVQVGEMGRDRREIARDTRLLHLPGHRPQCLASD